MQGEGIGVRVTSCIMRSTTAQTSVYYILCPAIMSPFLLLTFSGRPWLGPLHYMVPVRLDGYRPLSWLWRSPCWINTYASNQPGKYGSWFWHREWIGWWELRLGSGGATLPCVRWHNLPPEWNPARWTLTLAWTFSCHSDQLTTGYITLLWTARTEGVLAGREAALSRD